MFQDKAAEKRMTLTTVEMLKRAGLRGYINEETHVRVLKLVDKYLTKKNIRILDLGCGVGDWSETFHLRGHRVVGVDVSGEAIDFARSHTAPSAPGKDTIKWVVGDFLDLNIDDLGKFDAMFLGGVLHHLRWEEIDDLIEVMDKLLVAKGYIIAVEWNAAHLPTLVRGHPQSPIRRMFKLNYSPNERPIHPETLKRHFENRGFPILTLKGVHVEIREEVKPFDPNYHKLLARMIIKGISISAKIGMLFSAKLQRDIHQFSQFVLIAQRSV